MPHPTPTVTEFAPTSQVTIDGLHTTDGSATSTAYIVGTNLQAGQMVNVWNKSTGQNGYPRWSGPLQDASDGNFFVNLTCMNPGSGRDGTVPTTDQVCVSITSDAGTGPTYNDPNQVPEAP